MDKLAPCPCGQVPKDIGIDTHTSGKWGRVVGTCCDTWSVEFRADFTYGDELDELARKAWNEARRG